MAAIDDVVHNSTSSMAELSPEADPIESAGLDGSLTAARSEHDEAQEVPSLQVLEALSAEKHVPKTIGHHIKDSEGSDEGSDEMLKSSPPKPNVSAAKVNGYIPDSEEDQLSSSLQTAPQPPPDEAANQLLQTTETIAIEDDEAEDATPKSLPRRSGRRAQPSRRSKQGSPTSSEDELHAPSTTSSKRRRSQSLSLTPSMSKRLRPDPKDEEEQTPKLRDEDFHPPYIPLTAEELQKWKGWLEIESNPTYMNAILRGLGTSGIVTEEITDLEFGLAMLQPPVYGLIFLFQYQDSDYVPPSPEVDGEGQGKGEGDVWFANQLPATNACASIAMLNILMNLPPSPSSSSQEQEGKVELGKSLEYFREDTLALTPMEKAHCVNEHEGIRAVHNFFASKVDVWAADRVFEGKYKRAVQARDKKLRDEEIAARKAEREKERLANGLPPLSNGKAKGGKQQKNKKKKRANKSRYTEDTDSADAISLSDSDAPKKKNIASESKDANEPAYDTDSGFHYVAYIPSPDPQSNSILYLDGMSATPLSIGSYTHPASWYLDAAPHLAGRMAAFEEVGGGVMFNLMALVGDARVRLRGEVAEAIRGVHRVETLLDELNKEWRDSAPKLDTALLAPDPEIGLTADILAEAKTEAEYAELSAEKLLEQSAELVSKIESLKEAIRAQNIKEENERRTVERDRMDLNPLIQRILLDLEENGKLGPGGLLDEFKQQ